MRGEQEEACTIHNVKVVGQFVRTGSEPINESDFARLRALGVKLVVSVDGVVPKIEVAKRHGMRYVHIPLKYGGIEPEARLQLAAVCMMRENVYIHCHHGLHRGPAAAAAGLIGAGILDVEAALTTMEEAGTSQDYAGLWRDVRSCRPVDASQEMPDLPEKVESEGSAQSMANLDRTFKRLRKSVSQHHDTGKHFELAVLVREEFAEYRRTLDEDAPEDLLIQTIKFQKLSDQFCDSLRSPSPDKDVVERMLVSLKKSCVACHRRHRD